jgi:serine/threonine protein kinase
MIGKGGFGHVYYGKLEDGQEVAIKVLDVKSTQQPSEFFNEVDVLSRVNHQNLVSLIGYCHEDNQQMLIYEFMHKRSLRDHLYGTINSSSTFDFEQLFNLQVLIHIKSTSLFIVQLVLVMLLTFMIGTVVSVYFG